MPLMLLLCAVERTNDVDDQSSDSKVEKFAEKWKIKHDTRGHSAEALDVGIIIKARRDRRVLKCWTFLVLTRATFSLSSFSLSTVFFIQFNSLNTKHIMEHKYFQFCAGSARFRWVHFSFFTSNNSDQKSHLDRIASGSVRRRKKISEWKKFRCLHFANFLWSERISAWYWFICSLPLCCIDSSRQRQQKKSRKSFETSAKKAFALFIVGKAGNGRNDPDPSHLPPSEASSSFRVKNMEEYSTASPHRAETACICTFSLSLCVPFLFPFEFRVLWAYKFCIVISLEMSIAVHRRVARGCENCKKYTKLSSLSFPHRDAPQRHLCNSLADSSNKESPFFPIAPTPAPLCLPWNDVKSAVRKMRK